MIYSNFPIPIIAETIKPQKYGIFGKIRLGEEGCNRRLIEINCPVGLIIEPGNNDNLVIYRNYGQNLVIHEYERDWRDYEDPYWNRPQQLFLFLTTNFTPDDKNVCKDGNGVISTLKDDAIVYFEMYARGNGASGGKYGNKGFWECVIYRVLTNRPLIVRILPAGHLKISKNPEDTYKYLIIKEYQVYECNQQNLNALLTKLGIDITADELAKVEWGTL